MESASADPRVVSLIASGTEIVAALEMGDHLVGRSHSCDYPPWVERLPVLTEPKVDPAASSQQIDADVRALVADGHSVYRIDSEVLASLRPDVVVTQDHCEVCAVSLTDVEDALACLDLPGVEICTLLPYDLVDVRRDFVRVAEALSSRARGEMLVREFDERLERIGGRTAALPTPRVMMIEWLDPPMIAGGWMPELARIAGTEPLLVTEGESRAVTWEEIASAEPDQLLFMPCGFEPARTLRELDAPDVRRGLLQVPAARAGRCTILDGESYLNRPGPRLADSAELLAVACHPGSFPDLAERYGPFISLGWTPRPIA